MTKRSASVQATCCIWTYKKDEGCVNIVKCSGREDSEIRRRTLDAFWLDIEEAGKGEVLVINEESPRCRADKKEFLALTEGKKFERKKKIEAREYVAECLTEGKEYIEYILFVEPVCLKSEGTAHG